MFLRGLFCASMEDAAATGTGKEEVLKEGSIEEYLLYLQDEKNSTLSTLQGYRCDLDQLFLWAEKKGLRSLRDISSEVLEAWKEEMEEEGRAPRTIKRKLTTVRGYFSWLQEKGILRINSALELKLPDEEERVRVLSLEEISAILNDPDPSDWQGARDKALLELLYGSGLKTSQIVSLRVKDIDLQVSCIIMPGPAGQERIVPFGERARKALLRYISLMRMRFSGPDQILFISRDGEALSRQSIWKIVKKHAEAAGVKKNVSPGLLRSSLAVHLLEYGADPESVRDIMGHTSSASTRRYDLAGKGRRRGPAIK